jgi:hypothetical protein
MACLSFDGFVQRTGRSLRNVVHESMTPGASVPTLCEHGCKVEILKRCPHGCASIVVDLMLAGHKWNEIPSETESDKQSGKPRRSVSAPHSF